MASVRRLKKDIDYLVSEVIADCYTFTYFHKGKQAEVIDIINEAVVLRNELYTRANNPDGKDNKKIVKAYYKAIWVELFQKVDGMFVKISQLNK
jgi:hypothetical protein